MRHELSNPISGWMLRVSLPLALLLCQNSAMAQGTGTAIETTPDAATVKESEARKKAKDKKDGERVEVVGSRLKRVDVETAAPVVIVEKEQLEKSGAASVGDFFRKSAATSPTGNFSGGSRYVSSGAATIDLLGIGAARTLVLLNGRRIPTLPGLGSVNVDNIPTGVIERIEVLAGGASAVYGADAVGGVVNIITKKEFRGSEVSLFASVPQDAGGTERSAVATTGLSLGDDSNLILSVGGRQRDPIDKRKRDLSFANDPAYQYLNTAAELGTYSYRPLTEVNGKIVRGTMRPSANCPVELQQTINPSTPNDIYCTGLRKDVPFELTPKKEEFYGSVILNTALTSDWSLNGILNYSDSKNTSNSGRANYMSTDPVSLAPVILSAGKARSLGLAIDDETDYVQLYAPVAEAVDRTQVNHYKNSVASAKVEGEVLGGWRLQTGLSYTSSQVDRIGQKYRNSEALHSLYFNSNNLGLVNGADPQYIPIDPARNTADFSSIFVDLKAKEFSDNTTWDAFIDRQIATLPGGPLAVSIGVQATQETFKQTPDSRDIAENSAKLALYAGTYSNRGEGSRTSRAVAAEFAAPVATFVDVEGAVRFDNYSDFGDAVNYGLGTKIKVVQGVALRGRYATSFKAPNLDYLHQEGGGGYISLEDQAWCDNEKANGRPCSNPVHQIYIDSVGNPDLDPEQGTNYSAGVILEPIEGLTLISDYHAISLKKTFGNDDLQSIVDTWYENNAGSTEDGTVFGANSVRVNEQGVITSLGVPTRNMGRTEVRAVISEARYQINAGKYRFNVGSEYSRTLSRKEADNEETPLRQKVGYLGVPKWRWNNSVGAAYGDNSLALAGRTIARMSTDPELATDFSRDAKVSPYTEFDAVFATLIGNTGLQLGVNNILNTIGGVYDGNSARTEDVASQSLYSYVGRSYFARVTQSF
ncbi:MAG TPA: TonB-dependent receptor [Oligoflexus sp.]|uniref:TonB-dependent receptor domain-containing protein n=1 Tax=Oligoflexus sp. TaxID=1971216 RepID=UPI002D4DD03B|nr:TonB-dependent receptor [Oligoflexus sp.]HYX36145.1 TonB-dependent receptor [Oligoflexus sp.]